MPGTSGSDTSASDTFVRRAAAAAGILIAALAPAGAQAAGFALMEQSASGLGNAYAGAAALAEDASTVWWNPAGMTRLASGKQAAFAAHSIMPSARFHNGASTPGTGAAANGEGGDAGRSAVTPAAYFVTDLAPRWKLGLALNVPFGLSTAYDPTWVGRFQGIEAKVETVNLNPAVSWAYDENVSLGFGLNWQTGKIDLLQAANYGFGWGRITTAGGVPGLAALIPPGTEGQSRIRLDGEAWGYNMGVLWNASRDTRVGLAYRSSLKYKMSGTTSFSGRPALPAPVAASLAGAVFNGLTADGQVNLTLRTPDSFAASIAHAAGNRWLLLGDATWTGWSKINALPLNRDTGATLDTLNFNFRDTLRLSFGANYKYSDAWTLRAGYALDQTPIRNAESRSVRLPDNDRQWFSFGAQYRVSGTAALDFGYAHLVVKDAPINNDQAAAGRGLVNGSYDASVDILSAQLTYTF
jgi:long-chain fatty acid transport protein